MRATDLRLGNYVIGASRGEVHQVGLGILGHLQTYKSGYGSIPITEEWLHKLGFKKGASNYYNKMQTDSDTYIFANFIGGLEVGIAVDNNEQDLDEQSTVLNIKYVHELQNLYYSLKGEELTIKTK